MDIATTLIIVNLIITSISAIATPMITSLASCITRIKHSECCGSSIEVQELREVKELIKKNSANLSELKNV